MASKLTANYIPEILALGLTRSRPSLVGVNLTGRCNQRCIYCEIGANPASAGKDAIKIDDMTWVIDQMSEYKIRRLALFGGEPFLFDGIFDIIGYAGKKKIRSSVTTNGMTAHKLMEDEIKILKEYKTEINVSVDSFHDEIQAFTRGTDAALPNALKSIQRLKENDIPITALTVISKYNYRDLAESFAMAFEKGIRQVLYQPVIFNSNYPGRPPVRDKARLNVDPGDVEVLMDQLNRILKFEKKHMIRSNVYRLLPWIGQYLKSAASQNGEWFFSKVLDKFICREIYAIIEIGYDGGVQPCALLPAPFSIIHDKDHSLVELWSKATERIREDVSKGMYPECCNACCNHFSRNMLASIFKHPVRNRSALIRMLPLAISRIHWRILKNIATQRN